jgi:hypothetical protein
VVSRFNILVVLNEGKQDAAISLSEGHYKWDIVQSLKVDDKEELITQIG